MDTQQVTQVLQPVVLALITALVAVAIAAVNKVKYLVIKWVDTKTSASQQTVIDSVSYEAHAWAEKLAAGQGGAAKMAEAMAYASKQLHDHLGVDIPPEKLQAAIQAAWQSYNTVK